MISVWLDDLPHARRPIPEGWVHVTTVEEAKAVLLSHNVQQMSLDHDLGACAECTAKAMRCGRCDSRNVDLITGTLAKTRADVTLWVCLTCGGECYEDWNGMMPNCSHFGTGYDLVLWMAEKGIWPKEKPTVHSMNFVERPRMEAMIDRYFTEADAAAPDPAS